MSALHVGVTRKIAAEHFEAFGAHSNGEDVLACHSCICKVS